MCFYVRLALKSLGRLMSQSQGFRVQGVGTHSGNIRLIVGLYLGSKNWVYIGIMAKITRNTM